jgi:hypothetical protein
MINDIAIRNFESHEDTTVAHLSPGLNVICGKSNSGKTSIVRALKLAAMNSYNPDSLRIGSARCEVTVATDKGQVQVTRGPKDNEWRIRENGRDEQVFLKVGKNVVPDAARVIGIGVTRLGDIEVPVNIMDQLESHFMLAEVAGERASGSLRAQIIDEISGLSGVEGIIKSVGLDVHRHGRRKSQSEAAIKPIREKLHDIGELNREAECLRSALAAFDAHVKSESMLGAARRHRDAANSLGAAIEGLMRELGLLPDTRGVGARLNAVQRDVERAGAGAAIRRDHDCAMSSVRALSSEPSLSIDTAGARKVIVDVQAAAEKAKQGLDILQSHEGAAKSFHELSSEPSLSIDTGRVRNELVAAKAGLSSCRAASGIARSHAEMSAEILRLGGALPDLSRRMAAADFLPDIEMKIGFVAMAGNLITDFSAQAALCSGMEAKLNCIPAKKVQYEDAIADIMKQVKVCPLNPARAVSRECLTA